MSSSDYELALRLQQELEREYANAESYDKREVSLSEVWLIQLKFYGYFLLSVCENNNNTPTSTKDLVKHKIFQ